GYSTGRTNRAAGDTDHAIDAMPSWGALEGLLGTRPFRNTRLVHLLAERQTKIGRLVGVLVALHFISFPSAMSAYWPYGLVLPSPKQGRASVRKVDEQANRRSTGDVQEKQGWRRA